jgi:hypothetical protein
MGPDWKLFMDELIEHFYRHSDGLWSGEDLVRLIKDRQIQFLEKALKILDSEED